MDFWCFLASSYEGAYFGVRNRVRFCQKLKKAQIIAVYRELVLEVWLFKGKLGTPRDTVYPWGEGVNKQKTDKRLKWVCLVKSEICDVIRAFLAFWRNPAQLRTAKYAPSHEPVKNPENPSKFWLLGKVSILIPAEKIIRGTRKILVHVGA